MVTAAGGEGGRRVEDWTSGGAGRASVAGREDVAEAAGRVLVAVEGNEDFGGGGTSRLEGWGVGERRLTDLPKSRVEEPLDREDRGVDSDLDPEEEAGGLSDMALKAKQPQ